MFEIVSNLMKQNHVWYVCINEIWHNIITNGWYEMEPNQTKLYIQTEFDIK